MAAKKIDDGTEAQLKELSTPAGLAEAKKYQSAAQMQQSKSMLQNEMIGVKKRRARADLPPHL